MRTVWWLSPIPPSRREVRFLTRGTNATQRMLGFAEGPWELVHIRRSVRSDKDLRRFKRRMRAGDVLIYSWRVRGCHLIRNADVKRTHEGLTGTGVQTPAAEA